MLYAHRCSPDAPETLIAKFTRGERKGEQYRFDYELPHTACAQNKRLTLTFTCYDSGRIYTATLELGSGTLTPTGSNQKQTTVYNFFRSVSKNFKEQDWATLESFFHSELVARDGLQSLVADEQITFDFSKTAINTMVAYAALSESAGSMVIENSSAGSLLLQDAYCSNTDCNCKGAQVAVFQIPKDFDTAQETFIADVNISWAEGRPAGTVEKMAPDNNIPSTILLELINSPEMRDAFKARYQQIRQAKARFLKDKGFKNEHEFRQHTKKMQVSHKNRNITQALTKNLSDFSAPSAVKVGRNAPCPCGSAQKFKKCCGR